MIYVILYWFSLLNTYICRHAVSSVILLEFTYVTQQPCEVVIIPIFAGEKTEAQRC